MEEALDKVALHRRADGRAALSVGRGDGDRLELRYYSVSAEVVASGVSFRGLSASGWAFIVQTREGHAMGADYSLANVVEAEGVFHFTHLQHGWISMSVITTLDALTAGALRRTGTFTPAILHVNGVGMVALWFRSDQEERDCVIPLIRRTVSRSFVLKGESHKTKQFARLVGRQWAARPHLDNRPSRLDSRPKVLGRTEITTQ
jgi:hypothetical protein